MLAVFTDVKYDAHAHPDPVSHDHFLLPPAVNAQQLKSDMIMSSWHCQASSLLRSALPTPRDSATLCIRKDRHIIGILHKIVILYIILQINIGKKKCCYRSAILAPPLTN